MFAGRSIFLRLLFLISISLSSGRIYGQLERIFGRIPELNVIDTSDYFHLLYDGALDYNLLIAASKGYDSEVTRLIGKGAHINTETSEGATALIFAVANNKLSTVKVLLTFNPAH